jgi:hypothetical protein
LYLTEIVMQHSHRNSTDTEALEPRLPLCSARRGMQSRLPPFLGMAKCPPSGEGRTQGLRCL